MIRNAVIFALAFALAAFLLSSEPKGGKIDPPAIPDWIWWAAG